MFPLLLGFADIYKNNILASVFPEVKLPGLVARSRERSPVPVPGGMLVFLPKARAGEEDGEAERQVRRQSRALACLDCRRWAGAVKGGAKKKHFSLNTRFALVILLP